MHCVLAMKYHVTLIKADTKALTFCDLKVPLRIRLVITTFSYQVLFSVKYAGWAINTILSPAVMVQE